MILKYNKIYLISLICFMLYTHVYSFATLPFPLRYNKNKLTKTILKYNMNSNMNSNMNTNNKDNNPDKGYTPKPYIKKYDIENIINKFKNNVLQKMYISVIDGKIDRYIFNFTDNTKIVYYNDNNMYIIDEILNNLKYNYKKIIICDSNNVMDNMYNELYCEKND